MENKNLPIPPPPREQPCRNRLFSFGSLGSPPIHSPLHPPPLKYVHCESSVEKK